MGSPWDRPPERGGEGPPNGVGRRLLYLLAAIGALLLALNFIFPDWGGRGSTFSLIYTVSWLALLGAAAIAVTRTSMRIHARNALIWLGIFALILVVASFWEEWRGLGGRLAGNLMPGRVIAEDGAFWVQRAGDGQFWVLGAVNGAEVRFMIDTGASSVALTAEDARRAGIAVGPEDFTLIAETANGRVAVAPVRIESLEIGAISEENVPATVHGGELDRSLLGMSFLERLSGFEVRGERLYLYP